MKTFCENSIRMPSGATLDHFLKAVSNETTLNREFIEICTPNSHALKGANIGDIDNKLCFGCLNCIDVEEINYLTVQGSPSQFKTNISLQNTCNKLFQGKYTRFGPAADKLANHSMQKETEISNPLGTLIIWNLSRDPTRTFFCSSPSGELSINTSNHLDSREGHLDITICSPQDKIVCVLEGKASVAAMLRDISRDQWDRYKSQLEKESKENNYTLIFSYLVGGNEIGLYPENSDAPHSTRRLELYKYIEEKNLRFISIEALRSLRAYQLSISKEWNWETWFPKLFADNRFIGLLAGGIVTKENDVYSLRKAPWCK
ncbi:PD-(D/E)XK nuclease family protein [Methanolobus halotolerans]|uniref:Uncharacterized protein n=1 Tax=Methanolobus halotolerans TaxID=2052935 RepID=A0A4E0PSM9_9EURY|nr:PD-(D/E)XK nuclease family protein [Methanolobus halotolerans]TGC07013.1 hypothetical protein CUN85_12015 [Methanolobus halotolerans]